MVSVNTARSIALALEETVELPHFERTSFRVGGKIFATLDERENLVCLMFSPIEQSAFCTLDTTVIYPVPNKWGLKGATYVSLKSVSKPVLKEALLAAYCRVAPKRLSGRYTRAL